MLKSFDSSTVNSKAKLAKKQLPSGFNRHFSDEEARDIALSLIAYKRFDSAMKHFNYIVPASYGCEVLAPGLDHIAAKIKVHKRTVQRLNTDFEEKELIYWDNRAYNSNVYQLSPVFSHPEFRKVLAPYCKAFAYLCVSLVMPFTQITAEQYHRKAADMKHEMFQSQSRFTGSSPRNYSNIESIPKEYNQSLYNIRPDQVVRPTPESQRGLTPSQSEGNIHARGDEAPQVQSAPPESLSNSGKGLSKTAIRVCLLLKLEGSARFQIADFNDEELSYAEEMMPKYKDTIKDPLKWFKAVCLKYRSGDGRKKPSNFNGVKRLSGGQAYDSRGRMNCSPDRSLAPIQRSSVPIRTTYSATEMCSKDEVGAIFNPQTNVWYRRVQRTIKASVGNVGFSNDDLKEAFERNGAGSAIFEDFKRIIAGILPASDNTVSTQASSPNKMTDVQPGQLDRMIDLIKQFGGTTIVYGEGDKDHPIGDRLDVCSEGDTDTPV